MLNKIKNNKIVAVVLAVVLLMTAMWVPIVASASGEMWAKQASRDSKGSIISYKDFDWNALGENLVPDPAVAHFDDDGVYGKYISKFDENFQPAGEVNPYYWWDKYIEKEYGFVKYIQGAIEAGKFEKGEPDADGYYTIPKGNLGSNKINGIYQAGGVKYTNGLQSPAVRGFTKNNISLTADGTGLIQTSSAGGTRVVPLPAMEANSYYIIKFNFKLDGNYDGLLGLCLEAERDNSNYIADANVAVNLNVGNGFANNKVDTVTYVVYTGDKAYSDPFCRIYCKNNVPTMFDDFGMYKVTKETANAFLSGEEIEGPSEELSTEAKALNFNKNSIANGVTYDFSSINWGAFGENLIPDPTVSNFIDGVYGKYATPDANWKPTNINPNYWWDKYMDEYNGFTMYYQDMIDGVLDKKVNGVAYTNGYQSPANRKITNITDYASLTDDGSGVLTYTGNGSLRNFPLPAMEKHSYYVIKFNMKVDSVEWDPAKAFAINLDDSTEVLAYVPQQTHVNEIHTFAAIVYTGEKDYSDPYFWFKVWNQRIFIDDVCVYKVDAVAGEQSFATGKIVEPEIALSETPEAVHTVYDENGTLHNYQKTKWGLLGANLVSASNKIEKSTSIGEDVKYQLPELEEYSYYLVKMKADFAKVNNTNDIDVYNGTDLIKSQLFDMSKLGTDNNYVTVIIY